MSTAEAIIREIVRLDNHYRVEDERCGAQRSNTQEAILRQFDVGVHSLLVMGVSPRPGDQLFFGQVPAELLEHGYMREVMRGAINVVVPLRGSHLRALIQVTSQRQVPR